jgi:type I restriction enzyme S subunit
VTRLKRHLRRIEQGWSPLAENRVAEAEEWAVLKVGCVNGGRFDETENKALPATIDPIPELEIQEGDVLVSRANTRQLLGSAALVTHVRPRLLLCDKLYRLSVNLRSLAAAYLVVALAADSVRYQLEIDASGASNSMQNISQETLRRLVLALPPVQEQVDILAAVERETTKIDALVTNVRDAINRLKELRTALISAAVTGKIDVRDVST